MKKTITLLLFILLLGSNYAYAKAGLLSFGGEEIIEVVKLPQDERFETPDGEHVDIGYIYKSVAVLFVPIWNYDGRLVGITAEEGSYLNLPPELIVEIIADAGMDFPQQPYLDFWHRFGGKILFLLAIILFGFNVRNNRRKQTSFLSALPTARERLQDILVNSQQFTELEPTILDAEGKPSVAGLEFIGVRNYLNSFISVSIFNMNTVSVEQVKLNSDDFFERLLPLKKLVDGKGQSSLHYIYYTFDQSPSADDIALLKGLRKRKITKASNAIPGIIDFEKMTVNAATGAMPSKRILENCFIQAEQEQPRLNQDAKA